MSYQANWTQGQAGRLVPGQHAVRAVDVQEIAAVVNRRRRLVYLPEEDFSGATQAGGRVLARLLNTWFPPPYTNFRANLSTAIVVPDSGGLGGEPPSPTSLEWLWPLQDSDEDKVIVLNPYPQAGQVNLFARLNGGYGWTDPVLWTPQTPVRAVHLNELRQALELLRRGRWAMPVYNSAGLLSTMPDSPAIGGMLFTSAQGELRCLGFAWLTMAGNPALGLADVTVRPSSRLTITTSQACTVEVYRCRRAISFVDDPPTWNQYAPDAQGYWQVPGGLGAADAALIGTVSCTEETPSHLSGAALAEALQSIVAGQPQSFLFRRGDFGAEAADFLVELAVEFDLNSPPN